MYICKIYLIHYVKNNNNTIFIKNNNNTIFINLEYYNKNNK